MATREIDTGGELAGVEVILLSKRECHLCSAARDVLDAVRRDHPFSLRVIEIHPGDAWHGSYRDKIPVVLIDGRVAFIYRVDPEPLLERLRAAARA